MSAKQNRIDENVGQLGAGGGGSNDVDSGGGAGSGVPDAETVARVGDDINIGDDINKGDVALDRQRIFGDVAGAPSHKKNEATKGDPG